MGLGAASQSHGVSFQKRGPQDEEPYLSENRAMRRFRFHICTLFFLILILVLGVSLASIRESNEAWDSSIFTLTLAILLTSVLLAIHRTENRRAFWLGFALFGSAYLGLTLVPPIETTVSCSQWCHLVYARMRPFLPI
jgi:hypothetical protein